MSESTQQLAERVTAFIQRLPVPGPVGEYRQRSDALKDVAVLAERARTAERERDERADVGQDEYAALVADFNAECDRRREAVALVGRYREALTQIANASPEVTCVIRNPFQRVARDVLGSEQP